MKTYERLDDVRLGYLSQESMANVHGSYGETKGAFDWEIPI